MQDQREKQIGVLSAGSAYILWGMIPVYFKQLQSISPVEIVAHRIVWTVLLLVLVKTALPKKGNFRGLLRRPKTVALLACSTLCIASNWLMFVYAVNNGMVLQTSLGYFINPLISVALGMILLKESLRPAQKLAVLIAAVAVVARVIQFGSFPWIALFLACTFAIYGLLRKQIVIDPFSGLLTETLILLPAALAYHVWLLQQGASAFVNAETYAFQALIMFSGVATMVPLSLFAAGARRLNLTTIGILQYLCPCISFCIAIFYYGEAFDAAELWTFSLVWLALVIYTGDMFRVQRFVRQPIPEPEG